MGEGVTQLEIGHCLNSSLLKAENWKWAPSSVGHYLVELYAAVLRDEYAVCAGTGDGGRLWGAETLSKRSSPWAAGARWVRGLLPVKELGT